MFRRWLIRSLALTLLTLCIVAWVGSYWYKAEIDHLGQKSHQFAEAQWGRIGFGDFSGHIPFLPRWSFEIKSADPERWVLWDGDMPFPNFGFCFSTNVNYTCIAIPLYFPTLLSIALLWLVWRKTRPKHNGKGFPVEPTAKTE